ncbi:Uncharacterized protein GBIM_04432 [Gryllus bimaculatus]|nr:Uncharacterized protein GBIM_04432 [Gryllus bimaculatus]
MGKSRASCPLRRSTPSAENCKLNIATSKAGGANNPLLSDRTLTSSLSQWGLTSGGDYEAPPAFDNSPEIPLISPGPSSVMESTSMWEENFQDLSLYCQDPKLPNLTKGMATGAGSIIGPLDDELNTPEIGYEEFNFDSWSKSESVEDHYLFEENAFGKIGGGHCEEESLFSDQQNPNDLPDERNMGLMHLDYNPGDSVIHEQTESFTSRVDVSNEPMSTDVGNDVKVEMSDSTSINERMETVELFSLNTEVSNNSSIAEIMVVEDTPLTQSGRMPTKLSLPLTTFENPVALNTPDVIERLDTQPGFDLVQYVLEDNVNGRGTCEVPQNQSAAADSLSVSHDTDTSLKEEFTVEDPTSESTLTSVQEDLSCKPHFVVVPSAEYSPVRICIKKDPDTHSKPSCSSQKRKHRVKKLVVVDESASSDDDDDDEYSPPVKVKKRTASCSKTTNECSRYRELRDRNNEASRKSRQNRKAREEEMKVQAAQLEVENQRLKIRAEELEKLVDTLRKALLTAMVKGK